MSKTPVTVAYGDGIGPEIMDACIRILSAAGADLDIERVEVGEKVYLAGNTSGIDKAFWESIRRTKVFYKAPLTTPQGGGFKSVNVTTRKTLGLFANIRPSRSYAPFVSTKHPKMDVLIVRENEEDLYAGIEHQQTDEVYQCLKLMSRPGTERLVRYGFEYARAHGRKKVTCFTKDNIMKLTDGMFHKVFDEVAKDYPDLENEHWIVDIGAAKLADTPEAFDVIILPNLYGDILSDVAAQIGGSVGLAGSANVGEHASMFEAIHGSAPRRAGQNLANPSGLLMGGIMMLQHLQKNEAATAVHNAWLRTIEDGVHTYDVFREGTSTQKVGTREFADAVIARLGQSPRKLSPVHYKTDVKINTPQATKGPEAERTRVGIDVFLRWDQAGRNPAVLGEALMKIETSVKLKMLTNRGQKVWPDGASETFCTDHWRCRYEVSQGGKLTGRDMIELLSKIDSAGFEIIKTEHLYNFDGKPAYTAAQGQ